MLHCCRDSSVLRILLVPGFILLLHLFAGQTAVASDLDQTQARYESVPRERVLDAVIEAKHQATVSAQISGRVTEIFYDVDDYVAKGNVLVKFRDRDQRAAFDAAQANFKEAQSEYKRVSEVYKKKLVARSVLDKAESRLKSTKARLEQAAEALGHTLVRAPYSGIVVRRHIEVGESARIGQKLMTGLSLENLRAVTSIPQDIVHKVRELRKARILLGDDPRGVSASSLTISPYADPKTHTFVVRIDLPDGDFGVYPGMFTKVAFVVGTDKRLVIPARALVQRSEVSAIYVIGTSGISLRQVRVGRRLEDDRLEILAGLEAGEQLALDPIQAGVLLKKQATAGVVE